jgi:hypothetical protein
VQLCRCRRLRAFKHLLDKVDASSRAIQLVTQQLVGGAGGGTEAAVHALAQNGLGLAAVGRVLVFRGELGLHARIVKHHRAVPDALAALLPG